VGVAILDGGQDARDFTHRQLSVVFHSRRLPLSIPLPGAVSSPFWYNDEREKVREEASPEA
jgi:hypothetical protein